MNNQIDIIGVLENRNSKPKSNHRIGSRDIANQELKEISTCIDNLIPHIREAVEKAKKYDNKEIPMKKEEMKKVILHYPKTFLDYTEKINSDCWGAQESASEDYKFLKKAQSLKYETTYTANHYGYGAMIEIEFTRNKQLIKRQYVPRHFVKEKGERK